MEADSQQQKISVSRDEKMGTSRPEIEVVREQPASSEESKSIVNIAGKPAGQAGNLNRDQVNNQEAEVDNQDV